VLSLGGDVTLLRVKLGRDDFVGFRVVVPLFDFRRDSFSAGIY
jgi:hypothetical protein